MTAKILYVEDELALANIVKDMLENEGYDVSLISDRGLVLDEAKNISPDLCLLDVMLPTIDGFTLGTQLSKNYPDLPIIYLTAKNQFSLEELLARMENLLQLKKGAVKEKSISNIQIGQYIFLPNKLLLVLNQKERKLTHRESEIIRLFSKHKNGVIHKKEILKEVWGDDSFYNSRSLDVYINRLRDFFSGDSNVEILTLRGVGYRFNVVE